MYNRRDATGDPLENTRARVAELTREIFDTLASARPGDAYQAGGSPAHELRGKIVGLLIRRARLRAELSAQDCAEWLGVAPGDIEAWERGESLPGLPQVETLAACLAAPEDDFATSGAARESPEEYLLIRQRLMGALLQSARVGQECAAEELSAACGIEPEALRQYEYGERTIPLHHLATLAEALGREWSYFADASAPVPAKRDRGKAEATSADGDNGELETFATDRRNRAFIRLAMAFRDMDRADLDRIAAALLAVIRDGQPPSPRAT